MLRHSNNFRPKVRVNVTLDLSSSSGAVREAGMSILRLSLCSSLVPRFPLYFSLVCIAKRLGSVGMTEDRRWSEVVKIALWARFSQPYHQ